MKQNPYVFFKCFARSFWLLLHSLAQRSNYLRLNHYSLIRPEMSFYWVQVGQLVAPHLLLFINRSESHSSDLIFTTAKQIFFSTFTIGLYFVYKTCLLFYILKHHENWLWNLNIYFLKITIISYLGTWEKQKRYNAVKLIYLIHFTIMCSALNHSLVSFYKHLSSPLDSKSEQIHICKMTIGRQGDITLSGASREAGCHQAP